MPDKKQKPRKSPQKALADRVYKHYKALKRTYDGLEFIPVRHCESCVFSTWPHMHGYNKVVTTDSDWLLLARTHGLSVREVKDIVSRKRGWTPDKIIADREQAVKVYAEGATASARLRQEYGLDDV